MLAPLPSGQLESQSAIHGNPDSTIPENALSVMRCRSGNARWKTKRKLGEVGQQPAPMSRSNCCRRGRTGIREKAIEVGACGGFLEWERCGVEASG